VGVDGAVQHLVERTATWVTRARHKERAELVGLEPWSRS
jgi:hypothetical protein